MAGGEHADLLPGADPRADRHGWDDGLIGGAQPAVVVDGDDLAVHNSPREHHDTVARREHGRPRDACEVDPAMAGSVGGGGGVEGPHDVGWMKRPREAPIVRRLDRLDPATR